MPLADFLFEALSPVQSDKSPTPVTITAAATISPQTAMTVISGTTAVATITPPIAAYHELTFRLATTNFSGFTNTGNVAHPSLTNTTVWTNKLIVMAYDPIQLKYYPNYPGPLAATNA